MTNNQTPQTPNGPGVTLVGKLVLLALTALLLVGAVLASGGSTPHLVGKSELTVKTFHAPSDKAHWNKAYGDKQWAQQWDKADRPVDSILRNMARAVTDGDRGALASACTQLHDNVRAQLRGIDERTGRGTGDAALRLRFLATFAYTCDAAVDGDPNAARELYQGLQRRGYLPFD